MIAAGIDLGGTKIEAQIFDLSWNRVDSRRISTPKIYVELVAAMAAQITWVEGMAGSIPIGVSAAGLINPITGLALTANLPASGKPFPADIARAAGRAVTYVNDCRAQALSEAIFGAGRGFDNMMGLNLGTGLAGGIVVNGKLLPSSSGTGGEFGHFALAAAPMIRHKLPVLRCGCGRIGCTETLIAGPGLSRIVAHKTGRDLTPEQIVVLRKTEPNIAKCWQIWLDLLTDLMITLTLTVDPACVVLCGGLARAGGLIESLSTAVRRAQLVGYGIPEIRLAEGGDATGARGAAYAAYGGING
jgi:N-acetylglucosamine kinase